MDFLILVTGFNCSRYVHKCVESLRNQTYKKFTIVFINDGSNDLTGNALIKHTSLPPLKDFFIENFSDNSGAAKRRYDAIKKYAHSEETVILLMGMDDELTPTCLETIKREYEYGKWMTYGSWVSSEGETLSKEFLLFDDTIHMNRSYRTVKYRSTAPNTFKRFLFDQLTENDFKFNNEWVKATTESNLMFSCLEMCGKERIGVIYESIYFYNCGRRDSARRRFGNHYQDTIFRHVISLPKKPLLIRPI